MITRASSGIGTAVAPSRTKAYTRLATRREDALLEVQAGTDTRGGEVKSPIAVADVTGRKQVNPWWRAEEELSLVDILVNCVGDMYYALLTAGAQEVRFERVTVGFTSYDIWAPVKKGPVSALQDSNLRPSDS